MSTAVPLSFVHRQHVFDDVTGLVRPSMAIGPSTPPPSRFLTALIVGATLLGRVPIGRHARRAGVRPGLTAFQYP